MIRPIIFAFTILFLTVYAFNTGSAAAERLISVPTEARFEKVGDFESLRLPDGSRLEMKRIVVHDNAPVRDNIFGECEVKFYDQAGRLREGKGYLIMNPAEGKLVGGKVRMPVTIKFVPGR